MYNRLDENKAWPYTVAVVPATLPLTIDEVKEHLRLDKDDTSENALLIGGSARIPLGFSNISVFCTCHSFRGGTFSLLLKKTPLTSGSSGLPFLKQYCNLNEYLLLRLELNSEFKTQFMIKSLILSSIDSKK